MGSATAMHKFRLVPWVASYGTLIALLSIDEITMAGTGLATTPVQLQQLQTAQNIVLMVIPHDVSFRFRVDEKRLPEVSCVYRIAQAATFNDVLKVLNKSIFEYKKDNREIAEVRVGIIFENKGNSIQEFYFEDWGGAHDINGISGEYRLLASADLPNQLRTLLTRQEVALIKSGNLVCPHS